MLRYVEDKAHEITHVAAVKGFFFYLRVFFFFFFFFFFF